MSLLMRMALSSRDAICHSLLTQIGVPLGRFRAPLMLETSLPGVFAIGNVRAGSVKRVASAVGEGLLP